MNSLANSLNIPNTNLSFESATILQQLKAVNSGFFFWPDKNLVKTLNSLEAEDLTNILDRLFQEVVQEETISDPIAYLDRLTSLIPFQKLQESVQEDIPDALREAKGMLEEAKLYLQMTNGKTSPSLKARLLSVLEGILTVIETLITAFGMGDFFKPVASDSQSEYKSQRIVTMITQFNMFSLILLPLLGTATGGLIIAGTLLTIAALSLLWPSIKPLTAYLPANAENWTRQARNGRDISQGRKESLDEIAAILKMNRHVMLVGPSRVGKSQTARAFAQAVERGDYPELQGKVIFRINTADLSEQKTTFRGSGDNNLVKISTAMGRHRDDIILVFDEIHMACKNEEKIADQMKTYLDEGGDYPHVIGITTDDEYEEYVKNNNAFSLRFDRVTIQNTSKDETMKILGETILQSPSKPLVEEGVLDYLYEKSTEKADAPQPAAAVKLLKRCIHRTERTQKSLTETKVIEISNLILSLRSQMAATRGRTKELRDEITQLENELQGLQNRLILEQKELAKLHRAKELLDLVSTEMYATVVKVSGIGQTTLNTKHEKPLKRFILLHEFLSRSLESYIHEKAESLGVNLFIDESLIDEEVEEI